MDPAIKIVDWSEVFLERQTAAESKDQSFDLPNPETLPLYKPRDVLTEEVDFEQWHRSIMNILRLQKLDRLVESAIERPPNEDDAGRVWFILSLSVKNWLELCIHPDIVARINNFGTEAIFADKFMEYLRREFRAERPPTGGRL